MGFVTNARLIASPHTRRRPVRAGSSRQPEPPAVTKLPLSAHASSTDMDFNLWGEKPLCLPPPTRGNSPGDFSAVPWGGISPIGF